MLNGQLPYFIDWSQYAYLEREVNSGYTVIEIPRSAFAGGFDFYLLEVKFMDLQEVAEFFTLDEEDVEINYRVVIHLDERTSVGTY